jgi:signal transduction histidine kinase
MAPPAANTAAEAQRRFGRQVTTFVIVGFLALLGAALAAALVVVRTNTHSAWVAHTYQVEEELEIVSRQGSTMRAEAILAAYRHEPKREQYAKARTALFEALDELGRLTADNPRQQARIPRLRAYYQLFAANYDAPVDQNFATRVDHVEAVRQKLVPMRQAMVKEEHDLLTSRVAAAQTSVRRFWIVLPLAGVLLVVVAVVSVLAIRKFTADLARSKDELEALNEGLEDAVNERTRDLQRANDEIQRFAYIVSHDLRSPLVNVMGFTAELDASRKQIEKFVEIAEQKAPELVTEDARIAVREDLPEAIGFIRSSTQRMDRLINAILRLSREGRRTLAPELLDTTSVVQSSIDSQRHRIDELGVDIAIEGALPTITSDRVAIEQIMNNLIENATKYLAPGRSGVIRIRGRAAHGRATIEICDNGRGVDPRDHERIFDLFRRSGMQDQPGEGIGLAHVRALAHRLGGTVDVASELDKGATFKVNLPVAFAGEKDKAA